MNYIIVDDEPQARKLLQAYMADLKGFNLVKLCASAMEAYEALYTSKVDLMFLDIKMPIVSGTDFLRSLKQPPLVIFTTAYNKYALEGYELNVIDYLLKPISMPRLIQAVDKAKARLMAPAEKSITHIFIKQENKLVKISLKDILLIESMQNFVKIHLKESILLVSYTLKAMEELLPEENFLRVHRSFIVPVEAIKAVNGNTLETSYKDIPIGLSYRNGLINTFKIFK